MTIKFTSHSEPQPAPAEDVAGMNRHAGLVDDHPRKPLPTADEVLDHTDDVLHSILAPYENTALDANRVENLKRQLAAVPHVSSVGVSVVDGLASFAIRVLLRGVESWIKAEFEVAKPAPAQAASPVAPIPVTIVPPADESHD